MDVTKRWTQMEGQLMQLAGEVRDRRAKVQRLQAVLDATQAELERMEVDIGGLRAGTGDLARGRGAAGVPAHVRALQLEAIDTVSEQVRELVALHRVFRDLSRMMREVTGNHEVRIQALEWRLFGEGPPVH